MFTPKGVVVHESQDAETNGNQKISRKRGENTITHEKPTKLNKAAAHSLESMGSLFENPLNDPSIVVAETEVMIQGREAVGLARFLHFV